MVGWELRWGVGRWVVGRLGRAMGWVVGSVGVGILRGGLGVGWFGGSVLCVGWCWVVG